MAKAKKTAAQRRAQAKRAAARDEPVQPAEALPSASHASPADATPASAPQRNHPVPPAPPPTRAASPPAPEPPVPVTASTPALRRPSHAAASPSTPPRIGKPRGRPLDVRTAAPPPRRDTVRLLGGAASADPWRSLRRRRRRRPHRHERRQHAQDRAQRAARAADLFLFEDAAVEDIRDACFDALGSLYEEIVPHAAGTTTPSGLEFSARDEGDCFTEIAHALALGDMVIYPRVRTRDEADLDEEDIAMRLMSLSDSVWDAFVVTHSFLTCSEKHWRYRPMPEMQEVYLAGLTRWFFSGG